MGSGERMIYIYSILNKITNKSYIGKTINPKYREYKHLQLLRNNKHPNIKLQRSYNKHGYHAFEFFVIFETDDSDNWGKYESLFIELFNTRNDEFGYNIGAGGESNMITKEIQAKQKQSNKDRWPNVYQIDIKTNVVINKFQSCMDASRNTNIGVAHINDVCNLKHQSAGGYYWCYENHWNKNWRAPLHHGARPIALFDKSDNIKMVFRNKDDLNINKAAYRLYANKKKSVYVGNYILRFISKEEYYNFTLNRTCND